MKLNPAQLDRACGVLMGAAVGDALGAGYEFAPQNPDLIPEMIGGGLGGFAPGEWTDDTAQTVAIARVAATGIDLRTTEALDQIAGGFMEWYAGNPPDVGNQTRAVLSRARQDPTGAGMAAAARAVHESTGRSAGNGSLMRTAPVALAYLDDPAGLVEAAMAVSSLTHHDELAQEACAVWCLMLRYAVLTGGFPILAVIEEHVPNPGRWYKILAKAEWREPHVFEDNGWALGALQAAWSSIMHTTHMREDRLSSYFPDSLTTAIRIGHDTDTVASIAGAMLGAMYGMSVIPARWRRLLHGWPGIRGNTLEEYAVLTTRKGDPLKYGWPLVDHIDYTDLQYGKPALSRHPHDEGVWLASATALDNLPDEVDAVVSLCLTGRKQVPEGVEQLNFRVLDEPEPEANPNLDFMLVDAAQTIAQLRSEGKTVLLHCVASHSRTPAFGIAYSMLLGIPLERALSEVCGVLPAANPNRGFREALARVESTLLGLHDDEGVAADVEG
jgi:ADP-ribosyl-[dinitrogen reductase] hydrolase